METQNRLIPSPVFVDFILSASDQRYMRVQPKFTKNINWTLPSRDDIFKIYCRNFPPKPEVPDSAVVIDHEIDAILRRIIAPPPSPLGGQIATVTTTKAEGQE